MPTAPSDDAPLPRRIALASIVGFWAFYLTILTGRSLLIYRTHLGFLSRAAVSLACIGLTYVFYLLLKRVPIARLRTSIAVAALLAVPAALTYSTINWAVFSRTMPMQPMPRRNVTVIRTESVPPLPPVPTTSTGSAPAPPVPPAPPPVQVQTITVGKADDRADMERVAPLMQIADQAANGYFFFICWAALYLALCYANRVGTLERRTAALAAAKQSAELRALRYQVNPHFLFNTLNSLSSLVMTGRRDEAERMIMNLSTFFRSSLAGDTTADVPLSEELRLQRLYLDIEAVRFPSRQIVAIDVPEILLSACVPGLVLQPLVENAVKHGVSRTTRPVTIRIAARDLGDRIALSVEDDAAPLAGTAPAAGTGLGLRNVCDRLEARFGAAADCAWGPRDGGGFAVTLAFPLVRDGC